MAACVSPSRYYSCTCIFQGHERRFCSCPVYHARRSRVCAPAYLAPSRERVQSLCMSCTTVRCMYSQVFVQELCHAYQPESRVRVQGTPALTKGAAAGFLCTLTLATPQCQARRERLSHYYAYEVRISRLTLVTWPQPWLSVKCTCTKATQINIALHLSAGTRFTSTAQYKGLVDFVGEGRRNISNSLLFGSPGHVWL